MEKLKIHELISLNDDGNISAIELANQLNKMGYNIGVPLDKEGIEFSDLSYEGKKVEEITMQRSVIGCYMGKNEGFFDIIFS